MKNYKNNHKYIAAISIIFILICEVCFATEARFIAEEHTSKFFIIHENIQKELTAPVSPCSLFGRGYKAFPGNSGDEITSCWLIGDWSQCSNGCGQGTKEKILECVDLSGDESNACQTSTRPNSIQSCVDDTRCDFLWKALEWDDCSNTCGDGTKSRLVQCETSLGDVIEDVFCSVENRPAQTEACSDMTGCVYSWQYGEWGECDGLPWQETQSRLATCVDPMGEIVSDSFCTDEKVLSQTCPIESLPNFNSCLDAHQAGKTIDGYYKVGGNKTYCDMANGGWTLIAKAPSGNTEFRYDGVAWNDSAFGSVDGTGSYISPLWSNMPISQVRLVMAGGVTGAYTATSSTSGSFASLRKTNSFNSGTVFKTGSSKVGCSWAATMYYRFAFNIWHQNSCSYAITFYGLGIKHTSNQASSGKIVDGDNINDKATLSSFQLFVK